MYFEGEVPTVVTGNGYSNNNGYGFGGEWGGLIGLLIVASLFGGYGFGGRGFGSGFGGGTICGSPATQADLANGFAQNTLQRGIDDIILGQATMQNFINQGFSGINTSILTGVNTLGNAVCTLGYQTQSGFNGLSSQLASCCCDIRGAIADVKYANEKQTCDIVNAINMGNQRLLDIYTNDKIDTLNRKLATAEAQLSNNAQSRYIVDTVLDKLSPCAKPSYLVPNPNCCYNYTGFANTFGNGCVGVQ